MVGEVELFGHRVTNPLVSCVVTEILHRTEILIELVREPATSFANEHGTTLMTCNNIDYTGRSAAKPILKSNTSASGRDRGRFSSEEP